MNTLHTTPPQYAFIHFLMIAEFMHGDVVLYVLDGGANDYMICTSNGTDYRWFSKHPELEEEADVVVALTDYTDTPIEQMEIVFI